MKKKELILTTLFLLLDQGSKYAMEHLLINGPIDIIPGFFSLDYVTNRGGAWSILNNQVIILIIVGLICLFGLSFMKPTIKDSKLKSVIFPLLYAGIIGNLLDRMVFGYVKDFLHFEFFHYHFPVFNIADVCIVIGAFLLIVLLWKEEKNGKNNC